MKNITLNRLALAVASVGVVVMSGCGGGGSLADALSSLSISGVAATGAAISGGAVTAKCATGTGTINTGTDGSYTLTVSNGTLPCLLQVLVPNTTIALYSAVEPGSTTANISPLTQLVVANALGADPATVFAGVVSPSTVANLSGTALTTSVGKIQTALVNLGLSLSGIDPLKSPLVAATEATAGNAQDKQIDGLMAALNNANLKVSDLSTVLQAPTTPAAAATAVTTFATNPTNPVSTSALANCPSARSGRYRYAAPGATNLRTTYLNFSTTATIVTNDVPGVSIPAMTGIVYGTSSNDTYTIAQVKDINDITSPNTNPFTPCAYKLTMTSAVNVTLNAVVNVRVSAAGLGVYSEAGTVPASFPNSTAVAMSSNAVGLFIPVQTLPSVDQLAGTSYGMHYSLPINITNITYPSGSNPNNVTQNFYSKFVIASNGTSTTPGTINTATAYLCTGLGVCDTTLTNTFTFTRNTANNLITVRSSLDPADTVMAMFRNQLGDFVGLGVNLAPNTNSGNTGSSTWTNNYAIFSNRVSPYKDRAVGDKYSVWNWSIFNSVNPTTNAVGPLVQNSFYKTFTVNSVINNSATDRSFTRTSDASPSVVIDTILLNNPIVNIGMIRRPAVTASATTAAAKDFVGFTGNGWTIAGGTKLNATAPSYTDANVANNFLSFSIQAN